ncbi:hypothetical protein C8R44DRAFT_772460 [Mycena epipterygia]|nr:hypothetical protein C8R44DRAFT_772460 [Mycena epipterygia]
MRFGHWTGPFAPRLSIVSLPDAESPAPRPASAIPYRSPPLQATFGATYQNMGRPNPPVPAQNFPRYEDPRGSYLSSSSRITVTHDPSIYENGGRIPATPFRSYTTSGPQRPLEVDRTRSMTPVPVVSILKSSRPRSHSLSSNPEAPRNVVPARAELRRSNLGKSQTTTVHRTAALKEESISLSWPLVQFSSRKKSKQPGPMLYFDVAFDPRQSRNLMDKKDMMDEQEEFRPLREAHRILSASTHCNMTEMTIECPHIGQITVKRSRGIRCIDVFSEIYDAYHKKLRSDTTPQNIDRYIPYFVRRCEDSGNREAEAKAGMRRVDLLRGKRIFDGLARSGADWKLVFDAGYQRL